MSLERDLGKEKQTYIKPTFRVERDSPAAFRASFAATDVGSYPSSWIVGDAGREMVMAGWEGEGDGDEEEGFEDAGVSTIGNSSRRRPHSPTFLKTESLYAIKRPWALSGYPM